eukprot:4182592-Prorocentrum_lima.AAC.1
MQQEFPVLTTSCTQSTTIAAANICRRHLAPRMDPVLTRPTPSVSSPHTPAPTALPSCMAHHPL